MLPDRNATPPAVITGPPRLGTPILNGSGSGDRSRTVPLRCFQAIVPVRRSAPAT